MITTLDEIALGWLPTFYVANTFDKVKHGKYRYYFTPSQTTAGFHTLKFPDPKAYQFNFGSSGITGVEIISGSELKLSLADEDLDIYMAQNAALGKHYKLLEDLKLGATTVFDNAAIEAMPVYTTHSLPASSGNITTIVNGTTQSGKTVFASYNISPDKADILYPVELYNNYLKDFKTLVQRIVKEGNYNAHISTSGPNDSRGFLTSIDQFNASLTSVASDLHPQITIATTGNIDYKRLRLESTDESRPWYWNVSLQDQSIKLPAFPPALMNMLEDKSLPVMKLLELSIYDADENKDYASLIGSHLDRSYYLSETNAKSKFYNLRPGMNGGRMRNVQIALPQSVNYLNREWFENH
jgi:hypothetical protein